MRREATGHYEDTSTAGETVRAFVPAPLPPEPPLALDATLQALHERALLACGRLDGVSSHLPNPELFLYAYVRREALFSSQIEGTQSSLSDLLLFELEEAPGVPFDDVVEVSSYVAGLEHGLARLAEGLPLSSRLLREIHSRLLARGQVPPPPGLVAECIGQLEMFIHGGHHGVHSLPVLVRAALAHVQFETIHPFLDGNGRLGRLLIVLMLIEAGVLQQPLLYLSLFFKQHRSRYYELLDGVRQQGDWEAWIEFFLEGVESTASAAVAMAQRLLELFRADAARLEGLGRSGPSVRLAYGALRQRPLTSINQLKQMGGLSFPTASKAIETLVQLGIAREITGGRRNRLFVYDAYLTILSEDSEPL